MREFSDSMYSMGWLGRPGIPRPALLLQPAFVSRGGKPMLRYPAVTSAVTVRRSPLGTPAEARVSSSLSSRPSALLSSR